MGKVSELSQLIEELKHCGNTLIGVSEELKNLFSSSEEVKETEPNTKTAEEVPAKAPKERKITFLRRCKGSHGGQVSQGIYGRGQSTSYQAWC